MLRLACCASAIHLFEGYRGPVKLFQPDYFPCVSPTLQNSASKVYVPKSWAFVLHIIEIYPASVARFVPGLFAEL